MLVADLGLRLAFIIPSSDVVKREVNSPPTSMTPISYQQKKELCPPR